MSFEQALKDCYDGYETLKLIRPEWHDDIMKNLDKLLRKWRNLDVGHLLSVVYKKNFFTPKEIKKIFLAAVQFLKEENMSPMILINNYGKRIVYNRDDLKRLFLVVVQANIKNKLREAAIKALNLNEKIYDAQFNRDKEQEIKIRNDILELLVKHIEKWKIEVSEEDMISLIKYDCPYGKSNEIFVDRVMEQINGQLEDITSRVVEEYFQDGMELVGTGSFSMVFKKDDRIFKICFDEEYKSYDSPNILSIDSIKNERLEDGTFLLSCGRQVVAETNWDNGLSREEKELKMYKSFCDNMDDGYIVTDINEDNFGLVDDKLVVLDSGFIYEKDSFDISKMRSLVPIFSLEIFAKFWKLYESGYRVGDDTKLQV